MSRRALTAGTLSFRLLQLGVSGVSTLVLIPLYLRHIEMSEYGAWTAVSAASACLSLIDPGVANLLIQCVGRSQGAADPRASMGFIKAGLLIALVSSTLAMIIGQILSGRVPALVGVPEASFQVCTRMLQFGAVSVGLMLLSHALNGAALGLQSATSAGLPPIAGSLARLTAATVCLRANLGVMSIAYAELTAATVFLATSAALFLRTLRSSGLHPDLSPGYEQLRALWNLALSGFGSRVGRLVAGNLDSLAIAHYCGATQLAQFSVASTAARQSENLVTHSVASLRPALAHLSGEGGQAAPREITVRLVCWLIWSLGFFAAGLFALSDQFLTAWLGSQRPSASPVYLWIPLLFLASAWNTSLNTLVYSLGEIRTAMRIDLISAVILVPAVIAGGMVWALPGILAALFSVGILVNAWALTASLASRVGMTRDSLGILAHASVTAAAAGIALWFACHGTSSGSWLTFALNATAGTAVYALALSLCSARFRADLRSLAARARSRSRRRA